jgi:hypothetical protein
VLRSRGSPAGHLTSERPYEISLDCQLADLLVQLADLFLAVGSDRGAAENRRRVLQQFRLPARYLVRVHLVVRCNSQPPFSPRIASSATRALNAAEWLRLGLLMDFPPVMPGRRSTYTRVRKTEATSAIHPTRNRNPPTPAARSDCDTPAGTRPASQLPSNSLGHLLTGEP